MEITTELRKRFCKDANLPINMFKDPYFTNRLKTLDVMYNCITQYELFCEEIKRFKTEQDYFEEYNKIKDEAINFIKNSEKFKEFNEIKIEGVNNGICGNDIYKETCVNKYFISIDIRKANFTCIKHYSPEIFDGKETWEEFIGKFTDLEHIKNSKYIRQVVLGNCNCGRHIKYEKYLMNNILNLLIEKVDREKIVFFSNDEIVFEVSKLKKDEIKKYEDMTKELEKESGISLKCTYFHLKRLNNKMAYIKILENSDGNISYDIKCADTNFIHLIVKFLYNLKLDEIDYHFWALGMIVKAIDIPVIEFEE